MSVHPAAAAGGGATGGEGELQRRPATAYYSYLGRDQKVLAIRFTRHSLALSES